MNGNVQARKGLNRAGRKRTAHMPHRSVPMTGFAYAGTMQDDKFGGRIVYESGDERDALIHMIFEPIVAWVRRNDLDDDERVRYRMPRADDRNWVLVLEDGSTVTADLLVGLTDGRRILMEIGPHATKTAPAEADRLRRAAIVAAAEGVGYVVITDRIIRGRLLENRRELYGWLVPVSAQDDLIAQASRGFQGSEQRSIEQVATDLSRTCTASRGLLVEAARAAVARAHRAGRLRCPLNEVVLDVSTPCAIVAGEAA